MALAPLIPEGFALADLLVGLGALLGWAVCLGLLWAWRGTFSVVFQSIAAALRFRVLGRTINLGGWASHIDNTAQHALSVWATGFENAAGRFFHAAAVLTEWTARELAGLASDTLTFAHYLMHQWIPDYIHGLKDILHSTTKIVTHTVTKVERIEVRTVRVAKSTAKSVAAHTIPTVAIPHVGEWEWLSRHWPSLRRLVEQAGELTYPGSFAGSWAEIRDLIRSRHFTHVRLRSLEKLLGATAMAAAMANVLGISARCVRSGGPIGRVARALCGLSREALNDLLGLLVDVLIVEDVCQVIVLLEDALSLVQGPLNTFVDVIDGALCHGDYNAPPALPVHGLSLPPVTGLVLSLP